MRARSWAGVGQIHVGGERHVAGDFLPDKMECVDVDPQIRAGGANGVNAGCGVEGCGSRRHNTAHVGLALKNAEPIAGCLRGRDGLMR